MALAAGNRGERLAYQLVEDLGGALFGTYQPDALPRHQRTGFDIAVDNRATQSPGPEMLDFELRLLLRDLAPVEPLDHVALNVAETVSRRVEQGADRDHRKARIELNGSDRVARRGPDEGALEPVMRDRLMGADEAGPELNARGAHFEIGQDRFAAADAAGDEDRHCGEVREHLLRKHRGRDGPDMATCLVPLDDDRVRTVPQELLCKHQGRCEAQHAGAAVANTLDCRRARNPAGEHDMADAPRDADIDQLEQLRMHRNQIDPERPPGPRCGGSYLGVEQLGRHRA